MHASRASVMLPLLLALLLSPAPAAPAWLGPAVGGDSGPADSPAEAPTAAASALERTEDEVVAGRIAAPPGSRTFRPGQHPSALSPEQRRGLEHEARCGPRVPARRGAFPWPGWNPRCRGGGATAPAGHSLQPLYNAP